MSFQTKLDAFEGPLDLLLHLIDKNKVDIYDIPISLICDQYMEYLQEDAQSEGSVSADLMSEFLVMAATLLEIKARMLLPLLVNDNGEEEDPRAELVERLLEYKLYKAMSKELRQINEDADRAVFAAQSMPEEVLKYEPPIDLDIFMNGATADSLRQALMSVLLRCREKINAQAIVFGRIQRDEIKIEDQMELIKEKTQSEGEVSFASLFDEGCDKMSVIVTFLAILELMKLGEIFARQKENEELTLFAAGKELSAAQGA